MSNLLLSQAHIFALLGIDVGNQLADKNRKRILKDRVFGNMGNTKDANRIKSEELAETLERLRGLTDGIDALIDVTDPKTHQILFANKKAREVYSETIVGKKCYEVFWKKDKPCPNCVMKKILGSALGKTFTIDSQLSCGRWFRSTFKAIKWPKNQYVNYAVHVDITKQKKYAECLEEKVEERTRKLQEAQNQLLKTERLVVTGQLAAMVGHDLRNPLTSITGCTYYLEKNLDKNTCEKMREMLSLINKNIAYSNKIINDLIDYSREIVLELKDSTPKSIMNEVLSAVKIPENTRLVNLTKNHPKMQIDLQNVKRAFINMITNAVDAMPDGGTITVESKKEKSSVVFKVSDTGTGIPKEVMNNLWSPLFTTKAKGMGFGLPICKRIVEAHGGSIRVESAVGKGATFIITLPINHETEEGGEKVWINPLESSLLMTTRT
jgi:signal transduction histidine kinase